MKVLSLGRRISTRLIDQTLSSPLLQRLLLHDLKASNSSSGVLVHASSERVVVIVRLLIANSKASEQTERGKRVPAIDQRTSLQIGDEGFLSE